MGLISEGFIALGDVKPGDAFVFERDIYRGCVIVKSSNETSIKSVCSKKNILCVVLYDRDQFETQDSYVLSGTLFFADPEEGVKMLKLVKSPEYKKQ